MDIYKNLLDISTFKIDEKVVYKNCDVVYVIPVLQEASWHIAD